MDTPIKEKKTLQSKKKTIDKEIKVMHDYNNPAAALMRIPTKNPTLNYRWIRNTPESIAMAEAHGYNVATGEQVRAAGLKPREDGSARNGDLILGVEPMAHHAEHKRMEEDMARRQRESAKVGIKGRRNVDGWQFNETIKQE